MLARETRQQLMADWHYDPDTGLFTRTRAVGRHGRHKAGTVAKPSTSHGYTVIRVARVLYGAHRLAWLYHYGEWPKVIDHINGDRSDNRIANLRNVTQTENMQNLKRAPITSKSGLLGAHRSGRSRRWTARIRINGVVTKLGLFSTAEEANAAYMAAKREFHSTGESHAG
jgi:hypothetical protein